ncbi:MAG: hypothetical protein M1825_005898 [Sarcosagium campestre]|nr:MAG: hypothetical protein M1825_005898 [Sarcosagium campestre]
MAISTTKKYPASFVPLIKVHKAPPSTLHLVPNKDAVAHLDRVQIAKLDPTGARTALFSQSSPDAIKAGDVLVVRQRNSDSFAGVCLSIRRRGVDTAILLRNQLTRVGVEMWFKIYSPNVEGIELVQRRAKRARRARLYYMRKPKHDMGSVQNIVREHSRQNSALSTSDLGRGSRPGKRTKTGSKKTM